MQPQVTTMPVAVIAFSQLASPLEPAWPSTHRALLPIAGKAVIVHLIEQLVRAGIKHVRIAGSIQQFAVRKRLGNGAEWGLTIRYSDLHGTDLRTQTLMEHGRCLYLLGDHLQVIDAQCLLPVGGVATAGAGTDPDLPGYWMLLPNGPRMFDLAAATGRPYLSRSLRTVRDYHTANLEAAAGSFGQLSLPGATVRDGASVDWDSHLAADVHLGNAITIGRHCLIDRRVRLESHCVIGSGSVLSSDTQLRNVSVLPNTFVGPATKLRDAVVTPQGVFDMDGTFWRESDPKVIGRARSNHEERTGIPSEKLSVLERLAWNDRSPDLPVLAGAEHRKSQDEPQQEHRDGEEQARVMTETEVAAILEPRPRKLRVAIVHDWCVIYGGAERVLEHIIDCYPEADVFSLIDHVPEQQRGFLRGKKPKTSFLQKIPRVDKLYRKLLFLMPLAIEQFDLSGYDLVISSSYCVAKGVLTGPNQVHVCYCHSPMRYAWDHYHEYLRETNLQRGPLSWFARWQLHKIRTWDTRSSNTVDYFIANSRFVQARIRKFYRRESSLAFPPVETGIFKLREDKEDFYVAAGRFVPFKRLDLAVDAFARMPDKRLVMIGDGPEMAKLRAKAGPNVEFIGFQPPAVMHDYLSRARAFIFPSEEDFGIVPVEAQASGTPVIAFGSGGALETVVGLDANSPEPPTGVFFEQQTPESLRDAVHRFEANQHRFSARACSEHAAAFGVSAFKRRLQEEVGRALQDHGKTRGIVAAQANGQREPGRETGAVDRQERGPGLQERSDDLRRTVTGTHDASPEAAGNQVA